MVIEMAGVDLLDPNVFHDGPPHHLFDQLRAGDPIHHQIDPLSGANVWSLTRFADIRAVSTDTEHFTNTEGVQYPTPPEEIPLRKDNVIWNDPPRHGRLRSFAAKAFSPRVVARFEDWIRKLSIEIVDKVEALGSFDAVPVIAAELPGQVICSIIGVPDEDRHRLIGWATDLVGRLDPEIGLERSVAAPGLVRDYVETLRAIKQRNPGVDMTTELLNASFDGVPITDDEFTEMVMMLILAGFETTHTLIAQGLFLMARDPDICKQVEETPRENLGAAIEELLRFISPVTHMARTVTKDFDFQGHNFAKGDKVILWYAAGNRDPLVFEEPNRFIAARGRRGHLAFGAGPHFCLGNLLARLEAEILFDELRTRKIRLELNGEPKRAAGLFINALRKLPMRVVV